MPDLASLHFLTPSAAITALAVGLPILLLFYFLKLRRRPVRVSSSMLWRDAARDLQVNVPWRLIRPSWLLLLQILILALLAGALGRPVLDLAAAPPAHTVIVIDQSASMAAREPGADASRLDRAKSRAQTLLARLSSSSQPVRFSILSYASRPGVRYAEGPDAGAARAAINAIEQTDEPGDIGAVLQLLKALTAAAEAESADQPARSIRVVFISDGGDAQRLATGAGADLSGLGDVEFEFLRIAQPPEADPPINAGITALAARRDYDDPSLLRVFVAIESNAPEARATSLSAVITPEGADQSLEIGAWPIQIPRATTDAPGRVTRSFDLISPVGGILRVSLRMSDALASDNTAWMTLTAPTPPDVWLVRADNPTETAASGSLRDAIEAVITAPPRLVTASEYEALAPTQTPDVVVFNAVTPSAIPAAPSLSFAGGLPIPGLIIQRPADPRPTQVAFWIRSDPLMRGVTFPGTTVYEPRAITLPDTQAANAQARDARVIARGSDGPLIAYLRDAFPRVVIGFTPDETNWWRDPSFPVFIANAIETLAQSGIQSGDAGRVIRTGEPVSIPGLSAAEPPVISGPNAFERPLKIGADNTAAVGSLPFAGVYRINERPILAASLLDPIETSLATSAELSIAGRSLAGTGVEELAPREIWHWFVIAAVALLAVEWFAYALAMRT